jgi:hypothetical protein
MKTVAADSCKKSKPQEVFIKRGVKQQVVRLIYHQQGTNRNKQVAVNEKSEYAGNKTL